MNFLTAIVLCVLPLTVSAMYYRQRAEDMDTPDNMIVKDPRTGAMYLYDAPDNMYMRDPRTGYIYDASDVIGTQRYGYRTISRSAKAYGYRRNSRGQSFMPAGVKLAQPYGQYGYYSR